MLSAVARGYQGWFHPCARLSVRMSSTGIDGKGVLANRVAVVTGSTSGIGFAIARRLAWDGAHVVISSRKQQNVDRAMAKLLGEGLSVAGIVCHVGKAEDREQLVAKALEHCGGVDFLVCSAGVNPLVGSTLGTSEQIWDKILSVNVKSPALLLSQLLPYMENRGCSLTGTHHQPWVPLHKAHAALSFKHLAREEAEDKGSEHGHRIYEKWAWNPSSAVYWLVLNLSEPQFSEL
ncbi:dehydrogenase/reductase SDR family member 2, mitochondrial isoform X3 [Gorilla gorilla gorilla]|uniref:dehydrogenase/reductase SDR family member 2, mitochondrial isoform X3 n=1 Tax=Gorilla gorilla gorilla TaxID=9595 RepID=UPI00300945FD